MVELKVARPIHGNRDATPRTHRGRQTEIAEVGNPVGRGLGRGRAVHDLDDFHGEPEELQGSTTSDLRYRVAASRFRQPQHRVSPTHAGDVPPRAVDGELRQLANHRLKVFKVEGRESRVPSDGGHLAAVAQSVFEADDATVRAGPVTIEEAFILFVSERIGDFLRQIVGNRNHRVLRQLAAVLGQNCQLARRQTDSVPALVRRRDLGILADEIRGDARLSTGDDQRIALHRTNPQHPTGYPAFLPQIDDRGLHLLRHKEPAEAVARGLKRSGLDAVVGTPLGRSLIPAEDGETPLPSRVGVLLRVRPTKGPKRTEPPQRPNLRLGGRGHNPRGRGRSTSPPLTGS